MRDLLFAAGVTAMCMAVPVALLTAYIALARWRVRRLMRRPRAGFVDVSERRLGVPNTIHIWVTDLEALRFRRLGEVQASGKNWVSRLYLAPAGTIVARASDKPYNVLFETSFEDGAAVATSWEGFSFSSPDLLMQHARVDVERLLELHQRSVATFAATHGVPVMIGNLAAWMEANQAIGGRFSGDLVGTWSRTATRRFRLAAAATLGLALGGALAALVSGALPA